MMMGKTQRPPHSLPPSSPTLPPKTGVVGRGFQRRRSRVLLYVCNAMFNTFSLPNVSS